MSLGRNASGACDARFGLIPSGQSVLSWQFADNFATWGHHRRSQGWRIPRHPLTRLGTAHLSLCPDRFRRCCQGRAHARPWFMPAIIGDGLQTRPDASVASARHRLSCSHRLRRRHRLLGLRCLWVLVPPLQQFGCQQFRLRVTGAVRKGTNKVFQCHCLYQAAWLTYQPGHEQYVSGQLTKRSV